MKLIFPSSLLLLFLVLSCSEKKTELTVSYKLPEKLDEVSGIAYINNKTFVIEDSKNKNSIYILKKNGKVDTEINIENIKNEDWEDLTSDALGNVYIGNFGNNKNNRKDLSIDKISIDQLDGDSISANEKITFYYPEQTLFPPSKKELLYDCEAFFEWNGSFYLFTKNRSKGFDGTTLIYKIPNKAGHHKAQLLTTFKTCDDSKTCAITSAAISNDGSKMVLLTHTTIWLFEDFTDDYFTKGKISALELHHQSQKEAICFKDDDTILIADEKKTKDDGNIYVVSLKDLKTKS
ncbi:hypothetical protein LXD69_02415 [Flavobacterium sediminilitoris]|uniref:SdiA-regulated protein n=1 Tax=Flavobacterium sediminilitoris TaxID=2024526 RepID=A0ABY4HND3_9FLAO|nr:MULTISPECIES: hypothetical protein [Flavobacterium]UOX34377.1 hypothetical protein LXD69_02415 [Flavobacterium sediminilitoris]